MSNKLIQKLIIPKYITKVKTSDKRRRKYYRKREKKRGKNKGSLIWKPRNPLPKTYKAKLDEGEWTLDNKNYLRDENGDKVLANPQAAGTPNYEPLSGNRFMSGYGSHHLRRTLTSGLKDFYRPYIKDMRPISEINFPLRIEWDFCSKLNEANWDADNMFFYWKYLQDTLKEENVIPEDDIRFITHPPAPKFIPVDTWEDRKFVVRFYPDDRPKIIKLWKQRNFT